MTVNRISPNFKANTTINFDKSILTPKQVETLTKLGESIAEPSDSIYFNIKKFNRQGFALRYEAKLKVGHDSVRESNFLFATLGVTKPFEYIQKTMVGLKEKYYQTALKRGLTSITSKIILRKN